MPKKPSDLSRAELVGLVEGLVRMMDGDTDDGGDPVWNPGLPVGGGDLVAWAGEELARLGLVPEAGAQK